ncbi:MAG TPA: FKBP-type peptidyl-prolyl cis-trans isomerase [Dissulfurispiraceae bacterium]|nr:FKBP-type peptidyl-prolyl cis-trans isomerase [Dissulfurispiraceae bacterium]
MSTVKKGDKVKLSYQLKLENGTPFETSTTHGPLVFIVGEGTVMTSLEEGVIGMSVGESKVIQVPVQQGYGPRKEERIFQMPKSKAPSFYEVGKTVTVYRADGKAISVNIIGQNEEAFIIDGNHPLAGQNLTFEVTLDSIE